MNLGKKISDMDKVLTLVKKYTKMKKYENCSCLELLFKARKKLDIK